MRVSNKSPTPLKVNLSEKEHIECKMKVKRGYARKVMADSATIAKNDKAIIMGGVNRRRLNSRDPVVDLDYSAPRRHPPHHN